MQYDDRIICFIDILGFKEHIKQSHGNQKKIQEIAEALSAIRRVLDIDSPDPEDRDGATITQFSDSLVISFNCTEKSGVLFTLLKLIWVQATLVSHGMLIRGSIVRGQLRHDATLLFGPGIVDAYEMETKVAMYPRIILGDEVLHIALNHSQHHPVKEAEYISRLINEDIDGVYYIDYFGESVENELNDPELDYIPYLEKIKDLIEENINSKNMSVKVKYGWVLSKYNENIDRISDGLKKRGISPKTLKAKKA